MGECVTFCPILTTPDKVSGGSCGLSGLKSPVSPNLQFLIVCSALSALVSLFTECSDLRESLLPQAGGKRQDGPQLCRVALGQLWARSP